MPEMDGFTTCKKIKKRHPELKILILTQLDDSQTIQQILKLGVHGYFTKNTPPNELEDALWKMRDDGFYFERSLASIISEVKNYDRCNPAVKKDISFTNRELEILNLTLKGLKAKEIADHLYISNKTVNAHKQNIQQKYGFESIMSAILYCIQNRIISA